LCTENDTLQNTIERPCGAIYNLAGQLVINWRPRAAAHSDATADDAFCSEGGSCANTFAAKSIIAVGILRVPQRARGAFA